MYCKYTHTSLFLQTNQITIMLHLTAVAELRPDMPQNAIHHLTINA